MISIIGTKYSQKQQQENRKKIRKLLKQIKENEDNHNSNLHEMGQNVMKEKDALTFIKSYEEDY